MGDLTLCGVLRTPMPHDPSNLGLIEWAHIKDRMLQAANELEKRAARIEALERQVKAADALADALENAVEELRFLIPGYAGAAVTEQQVEEDVSDYVAALTAYRATKEGGA